MCLNCLKKILAAIKDYEKGINKFLSEVTCECCRSYPLFLKSVNDDLKILCLSKMSRNKQVCLNKIRRLLTFEETIKKRINHKLMSVMEQIDNEKEDLSEGDYLNKANQLKSLRDTIELLEEADHR